MEAAARLKAPGLSAAMTRTTESGGAEHSSKAMSDGMYDLFRPAIVEEVGCPASAITEYLPCVRSLASEGAVTTVLQEYCQFPNTGRRDGLGSLTFGISRLSVFRTDGRRHPQARG